VHHHFRLAGVAAAQLGGQISVDLDHLQAPGGGQQQLRECPVAGTDFDCGVAALEVDRCDNAGDDGRIVQEVLAKALARSGASHAQMRS
jgi:hypothetical protein